MTTSAGEPVPGQTAFAREASGTDAWSHWFNGLDDEEKLRLMRSAGVGGRKAELQGVRPIEDVALPEDLPPSVSTPQDRYATTSWASPYFDFTVPSGQTCQLKKLGMEDLMAAGLLDMMNELGVEVDGTIRKAKGMPPVDFTKMLADPSALRALTPVLDRVLTVAVNQPKIQLPPEDASQREPGVVYPDHVDLADKIAIMAEVVGDLSDLKSLRKRA